MMTFKTTSQFALSLLLASCVLQADDKACCNPSSFNITSPFEAAGLRVLRGAVCVSGVTQPGGAGTAITGVTLTTFAPTSGARFTATPSAVTFNVVAPALQPAGVTQLSINIPINIAYTTPFSSSDVSVVLSTIENNLAANLVSASPAAITSINSTVSSVSQTGFTATVNLVVSGTTTANIWNLVSAWLLSLPGNQLCFNFATLSH
jgi:hypothetical protein